MGHHLAEVGHMGKGRWAKSISIRAGIPALHINRQLHSHIAVVALHIHLRQQFHHQWDCRVSGPKGHAHGNNATVLRTSARH